MSRQIHVLDVYPRCRRIAIRMLALLPLALGVLTAPQQSPPATQEQRPAVAWQRTLDDALAVQDATGLPLLIVVNMDGEVFNEKFATQVYRDPAFITKTRDYVCVVASPDRHSERDYDALGNRIECPRFGGCTCSEHINIEPALFRRYFDGKRNAPRHVGVSPGGEILFDRFLDRSMQTAIDAIDKHRGTPNASHLAATDDLAEMFRRRDAMARTLLERRYREAGKADRREILERAAKAGNQPADLLRMALRDPDDELAKLAATALAKVAEGDSLIDLEDALAVVDEPAVRRDLIARLRTLGRKDEQAARLASHFAAAATPMPPPWRNDWRDAAFTNERSSIEAELDRVEAALRGKPDDAGLRLRLATAQAAFAKALIDEGGDGIDLWFADAQRNAGRVTGEALQPEARAVAAIASYYRGDAEGAAKAAVEAMATGASERHPDAWLATNFLEALLHVTAQTAYARAGADEKASLAGEIGRTRSILKLLDERDGGGGEQGVLAGLTLLEFAGLRAEARAGLQALVQRFPGSLDAHNRWRDRMLVDLGAEGVRAAYARFVQGADDRATAQWYAGYAALVAGDRHTADSRLELAEAAYGEAVDRFVDSAAQNDAYVDTSHHYAVLALAGRADARELRGNYRGAVDDLKRAAELRPESLDEDDGLRRKPRAIAQRVQAAIRAAGDDALAAELDAIVR